MKAGDGPMKADADIVRLVLQGDRESFGALVARHEKAEMKRCRERMALKLNR